MAVYRLPEIDLSLLPLGVPFDLPSSQFTSPCWMLFYNESPYLLNIDLPDGSGEQLNPFLADWFYVSGNNVQITPIAFLSLASPPSTKLLTRVYTSGPPAERSYPLDLSRATIVGGGLSVNQLINDGNPSGTQFIESTPAGGGGSTISVKNDGTVTIAGVFTFNGSTLQTSGDNIGLTTPSVGGSPLGVYFNLWNGSALKVPFSIGAQLASALNYIDANGVENIVRALGGSTQTFIDIAPSDSATSWQIQESTDGHLHIFSGNEVFELDPAGGSGLKLSGVGGFVRAWSRFTGTTTAIYNHNLGTTPNSVLPMQDVLGSQTMGYDTPGATTVHITSGSGNAFSAEAKLMA